MPSARAAATPSPLDESLLVLFDGHALFHRAFHAIKTNLSVSKTGEPTNAVYGFTSSLLKTLSSLRPACAAVAFDRPTPTFRHRAYAEYKATRPAMPDEMRAQFGRIRQAVESLGLPIFELDGFEADDILGCLAQRATAQGLRTVIVTGDTDTMQLVSATVHVLLQRGLQAEATFDLAAVRERYGLEPAQIAHLKGLRGDPSDNIPGVSGIGDKTATALLQKFGTVQGIYDNLALVAPEKVHDLLRQGEAAARQGLELATIVTDLPLSLDPDRLRWTQGFDRPRIVALFRELEFMSLLPRLPEIPSAPVTPSPATAEGGDEGEARAVGAIHESPLQGLHPPASTGQDTTPSAHPEPFGFAQDRPVEGQVGLQARYRTATSPKDLDALAAVLSSAPALALHVQTSGADLMQADTIGLAVAWAPGHAAYIPLTASPLPGGAIRESPLRDLLEAERPAKVLHVAREALSPLANEGIAPRSPLVDTSVAAHMLGRPSLALPALVLGEFGQELPTLAQLLGSGRKAITFAQLPVEQAAAYACAAADYILRLAAAFEPLLHEQGTWGLFTDLEMPLAPVLVGMERHGILVDVPLLQRMGGDLRQQMAAMEADIYDRVHQSGGPSTFNLNSPKQLGEVLFEKLNLPHGRRTQTGWSTDAAVLEGLRGQDPSGVVERVLEYRELSKLVSTYLDALPGLVNPRTGRIHTTFNQTGSATGRISSNDPNLQNIPVRTELG
ncbi:MAG: DNA polymerase I, partial [Chloroflexi bacterium]|nr:DNA polymerase I [Chloroflexota bacterium]